MIAFDIAVVAQKVKVQLLYNGRHAKSEKVGGGVGWISNRSGWPRNRKGEKEEILFGLITFQSI